MQSLTEFLTGVVGDAFVECGYDRSYGKVVVSERTDLAQYQCNGALALARAVKQKPSDIGQKVADKLTATGLFAAVSLAGPGFINLTLTDPVLAEQLQELSSHKHLGCARRSPPRVIVLDFGGPNVAKPMHVGHLRSSIIGESLRRLLRFLGEEVIGDIHLGDWGTQIGMIITELQRLQPDLPYFDAGYTGSYSETPPF